jgi:hypothetical protein
MIRPPSLIKQYNDFWSEDPAFEQAPKAPPVDASEDVKAAYEEAAKCYVAKLTAAWETGDWQPMLVGNAEPTKFLMRPLSSDVVGILSDMQNSGTRENELFTLAFRLALVGVQNLENAKVKILDDERFGKMASLSWMADVGLTGSFGLQLIRELGVRALNRASQLSPKS